MKINKYLVLLTLLFVVVPIIFVGNTNELFEFPKMFFVYFVALLLIPVMAFDALFKGAKIKRLPIYVLLFLVSFVISTVLSSHLYTSVWGYYSRFNDGMLSILAMLTIYIVVKNFLSVEERSLLETILLITILPVGILGIVQHYGLSGFVWVGERTDRVYSTFGQPNWLAQYLGMLLPIVIYKSFDQAKSRFWILVYFVGFACLWFTYSLSGILAFLIGISLMGLLILLTDRKTFSKFAVMLGISIIIAITNPGIFAGRINDVKQDIKSFFSSAGNVIVSQVFAQDGTPTTDPTKYKVSDPGFIRAGVWQGSINLIKSSSKILWVGSGPETFPYVFQPFRPKQLNYSSEWNFVINKPHNYYLELIVEQGIIGLATFVLLLLLIFRRSTMPKRAGVLSFMVSNFFGWPVVATSLVFWFWLASLDDKND